MHDFLKRLSELDGIYQNIKEAQGPNEVLRYIGELSRRFTNKTKES